MTDTLFIRLLQHEDKSAALAERVAALREGRIDDDVYAVNPESFRQVPNTPFCYWVSERIRRLFKELPPFESEGRTVKQGLATADDFRFVRAWWEVPAEKILDGWQYAVGGKQQNGEEKWTEERIREFQAWCRRRTYEGKRWVPFAKGGEYSPYYADIHLVVNWENEGAEMKAFSGSVIRNPDYFFRPGLTWPKVTISGLSMRPLPAGTIFSVGGLAAFLDHNQIEYWLAFSNTKLAELLMRLMGAWHNWEVGMMANLPFKSPQSDYGLRVRSLVKRACTFAERVGMNELSALGSLWFSTRLDSNLKNLTVMIRDIRENTFVELKIILDEIEVATWEQMELHARDMADDMSSLEADSRYEWVLPELSEREVAADIVFLMLGTIYGRWDVRCLINPNYAGKVESSFDPLPVCPPGMLVGPDGLPAEPNRIASEEWLRARAAANTLPPKGSVKNPTIPDFEYPLRISWDGVLVDDPEHNDDIVRRVRDVLEMIWKDRAETIEKEACEILGVRELRDYFRKPANGGFWMDHVKRYSKSRRKAPIYWYLRSSRGNYGLWLYYHRLGKDILFKALMNYVEPKIRLEEGRLNTLRARKQNGGTSGRVAKEIEKEIYRLEQFVSELQDFAEKLRHAADLRLEFDLNDGVILNMAPLWELIPWNEPKKYWEELQEGKYDWSHIAYQLWPERVKEKCKTDRSLAIAHGLEDLCEEFNKSSRKKINR